MCRRFVKMTRLEGIGVVQHGFRRCGSRSGSGIHRFAAHVKTAAALAL